MQFIRQIYNKLCKLLGSKSYDQKNETVDNFDTLFSVDVDSDYNRHFTIYLPKNIDSDKILILSEIYAQTLSELGSGHVVQKLLKSLESSIDKNDANQSLLFDNIVLLFVEYSKIKSDSSEPMIQPLSVFSK